MSNSHSHSTQRQAPRMTRGGHASNFSRSLNLDDELSKLIYIGTFLALRYERLGDIADIHMATVALQRALDLMPDNHANKLSTMMALGGSLTRRFERLGQISDIDKATLVLQQAVDLTPDDHNDKLSLFINLGASLTRRFEGFGQISDINKAILVQQRAINLIPDSDTSKPSILMNLGASLTARYERLGEISDVNQAILVQKKATDLTPDGHPSKPSVLMNLGASHLLRFQRLGELTDISMATSFGQQALDLTPNGHPAKPSCLMNLGYSLLCRFQNLGEIRDIDKAIRVQQQALDLTPDNHANKPIMMTNLGNSLSCRFERLAEITDINKAIAIHQRALDFTQDKHPEKPSRWMNLASSLTRRFQRLEKIVDIDKAILAQKKALDLTPDGHANKPGMLMNLGVSLVCRFERSRDILDINTAILSHRQALDLTPDGHANKPEILMNLGTSLMRRSQQSGDLTDIDQTILYLQRGLDLTPDGHSYKPLLLLNLGTALGNRFKQSGEIADIDKAIFAQERALDLTPDDHANKPSILGNLGGSLMSRFERLGEIADIDKAIFVRKKALDLTPDSHNAQKPFHLINVGGSLTRRFEHLKKISDIEEAILAQQNALNLIPHDHAQKPSVLMDLGASLSYRFRQLGEIEDIDKAILIEQQALDLIPDGHSSKPGFLSNLAHAYYDRFQTSASNDDILSALSAFKLASSSHSGPPSVRFRAANFWAKISAQHSGEDASTIDAYTVMVSLIPRLAWLGNSVRQRFHDIRSISTAVAEAAAFACGCRRFDLALEWLEQGRSIVWGQALHLRTPMDSLATDHPDLHRELQDVARRLELTTTSLQPQTGASAIISRESLSLEESAQQHRRLTERWETLLSKVRACEGYHDFLQPKRSSDILPSSRHGTIVVINVANSRCDALIIRQDSSLIDHLQLPIPSRKLLSDINSVFSEIIGSSGARECENTDNFNHGKSLPFATPSANDKEVLLRLLSNLDNRYSVSASTYTESHMEMEHILGMLWVMVVKPVLNFLDIPAPAPGDELSHITWCATGPLALLPLHAAGYYFDDSQDKLYNYAVSSYTPTLTALLNAAQERPDVSEFRGLLAISQPATPGLRPLSGTTREVEKIKDLMVQHSFHWLDDRQATVESVLDCMDRYSWIHLACHAIQRQEDATQSAFMLYNGCLTLEDIGKKSLKSARFAFLSACQTATGAGDLPDEAIHLGAGMLLAGCQSVVATLWSISDYHAPDIAEDVYKELRNDTETKNGRVAYTLHRAVGRLRETVGEKRFISWVPFIHLGF